MSYDDLGPDASPGRRPVLEALAEALQSNRRLKDLVLDHNHLGAKGAEDGGWSRSWVADEDDIG